MRIPYTTPARWPADIPASRFASLVRTDSPEGCEIGVIGLADDLGVKLNGGRPGARHGPHAFREALSRYGVADPAGWKWPRVFDAGDVVPAEGETEAALHETHRRVSEAVSAVLDKGLFPVGIGGGHDLTFAFMRPVVQRFGIKEVIYFDAHLDVRPQAGSGMSFRSLVEQCGIERMEAHGIVDFVNSREHMEWFRSHGGLVNPDPDWTQTPSPFVVSVDLDVLNAAFAPGVSAPNATGWDPRDLYLTVRPIGLSNVFRALDIMELNPAHDEDQRTARVAALTFLEFLRGRADGKTLL